MAIYGSVHAREKVDFVRDDSVESEESGQGSSRPPSPKEVVDAKVKTLIKTVANEIQKSFSMKSLHTLGDEDEEDDEVDDEEEETEEEKCRREEQKRIREEKEKAVKSKKQLREIKRRQKHVHMEAPILDFELKEPTPEPEDEEYDETPVDFDQSPGTIDMSAAKSKIDMRRKASTERRLPASILAKRKPFKDTKEAFTSTDTAFTDIEVAVAEKLRRKELFSDKVMQTQWDISNAEFELSKMSDNEKADMMAKQISKMKNSHVNKILKALDDDVLDISVPMLIPFLSLQARMSLGKNIFKNRFEAATKEDKNQMVKDTFVDMMIKDITDIALLQEVIVRSQEKLTLLAADDEKCFAEKMRAKMVNIENDSFELGSTPPRSMTPIQRSITPQPVKKASPERSVTPVVREPTPAGHENVMEDSSERTTSPVAKSKEEVSEEIPYGVTEVSDEEEVDQNSETPKTELKKSDDEGYRSSESDEDKKHIKEEFATKEESDEGLDDKVVEETAPKETDIKKKILKVLEDAKKMDEKRSVRNYGRTFEFQGVKEQLRPVLPNDKRPQKAKRLDCLWNQVTATKQVRQPTSGH